MKKLILLAAVVTLNAQAEITIPNTFVAGDAASAEQVNANFTSLADDVDANLVLIDDNRIEVSNLIKMLNSNIEAVVQQKSDMDALTVRLNAAIDLLPPEVKLTNGFVLGTLISKEQMGVLVQTKLGEMVRYDDTYGDIQVFDGYGSNMGTLIFYKETGCAGEMYQTTDRTPAGGVFSGGYSSSDVIKQVKPDAVSLPIGTEMLSRSSSDGTCTDYDVSSPYITTTADVFLATDIIPNDYAVTGVPNVEDLVDQKIVITKSSI